MRKLLIAVFILFGAISLSGCVPQTPATPPTTDKPIVLPDNVDEAFLKYQNQKLGFQINIPKVVDEGDIRTIASGDSLWLVATNNSYLSRLPQFQNSISDFDKVAGLPWAIVVKTVNNDKELEQFIKNRYGADCGLGDKIASAQNGVYDVRVNRGNSAPEEGCFLNWILAIKYSPEFNRVAAWDIGQAPKFINSEIKGADGNAIYYDEDMAKSFKFVTRE